MTRTLIDSRFLEPEIETAPRAEIEALQEARVLDLVHYAWANSFSTVTSWGKAGVHPYGHQEPGQLRKEADPDLREGPTPRPSASGPVTPSGACSACRSRGLTSCTATSGPRRDPELYRRVVGGRAFAAHGHGTRPLGARAAARRPRLIPAGSFRNFWDELFTLMGAVPVFVDVLDRSGRIGAEGDREVPARLHAAAPAGHPRVREARGPPRPPLHLLLDEGCGIRRSAHGAGSCSQGPRRVGPRGLQVHQRRRHRHRVGAPGARRLHALGGHGLRREPGAHRHGRFPTARSANWWPPTSTTWLRR